MVERQAVKEKIATFLKLPVARVADDAVLTDMVAESFALVELVIELQEEFGARVSQEDLRIVRTVGDLTRLIAERSSKN